MRSFGFNDPNKSETSVKAIQIEFLERPVRFSLRHCSTSRKSCISTVVTDKQLLQTTYERFGTFEGMTWQQARNIDRTRGISIETKKSPNHKKLTKEFPEFETFGHFRVNAKNKSKYRIFGTFQDDCFCILKFDVDGELNH